ncbi:MAG: hypothetical protein AMXMBFR84_12040 [Candidatus Hydrogenedentota bacterium]
MTSRLDAETILLIDDDELILRATKMALEHNGFNVKTALGGIEGIRVFKEDPEGVRAVVLDFAMPDMDGKDVFHALREIRLDLPIFIYTGCTMVDVQARFGDITPTGFIQKPLRVQHLVRLLAGLPNARRTSPAKNTAS